MLSAIIESPSKETVFDKFSTIIFPFGATNFVLCSFTTYRPTFPVGSWTLSFLPKTLPTTILPLSAVSFVPFSILYLFSSGFTNLKSPFFNQIFVL